MATGNFKIAEQENITQELITNGGFDIDSNWAKTVGAVTISDGTANFISGTTQDLQQSTILTPGKRYKITFDIVTSTGGTLGVGFGGLGNVITGLNTVKTYSYESVCSTGTYLIFRGVSFRGSIDNVHVEEVQYLPTGTKYLTCTGAGIVSTQSKQTHGEWEFDINKDLDTNSPGIAIISDKNIGYASGSDGCFLRLRNDNSIALGSYISNYITSAAAFFDSATWYRMKIARLQSEGVFKDIPSLIQNPLTASQWTTLYTGVSIVGNNIKVDGVGSYDVIATTNSGLVSTSARYKVKVVIKDYISGSVRVRLGLSNDAYFSGNGEHEFIGTPTTNTNVGLQGGVSSDNSFTIESMTLERIYDADTFAVFIKGGDFGKAYNLVGTGSTSLHKESNYFITDLDNGDKITNILNKKQVTQ